MSQYTTGTVAVTNGDATVTGTGTAFLTEVSIGDWFVRADDGVSYQVASITDDTNLELTATYGGVTGTGLSYAISRDFTDPHDFVLIGKTDIEKAALLGRLATQINDLLANFYKDGSDYGIGTTNVLDSAGFGRAFEINGTTGAAFYARTNGDNAKYTMFGNAGEDGYFRNGGTGFMNFNTNGAEAFRLNADGSATFRGPAELESYTVAGVPAATTAGQMIFVSDESGGAVPAFSDGTNWRRVTDRAVVS